MECCHKTKQRDEAEVRALVNRLSRIEGQVRGIKKMIEESAYCIEILTQAQAVSAALTAFEKELLAGHIKSCLITDIKNGNEGTVDELIATLGRMIGR